MNTREKVMRTNKVLCLPVPEDINMILHSYAPEVQRKNSVEYFYTLYEHIRKQEKPCCLLDYLSKMEEISKKDFFILHGEITMAFLKMLNPLVRKDIFIGDKPFLSPLIVFYMSRSIDKHAKAEFNRQVYIQMELGYKSKMFRSVDYLFYQKVPRVKNVFHNALEYIPFYSLTSDVKMNDFSFVYLYYAYLTLILLIFALIRLMPRNSRLPHIQMVSIRRAPKPKDGSFSQTKQKNQIRSVPGPYQQFMYYPRVISNPLIH